MRSTPIIIVAFVLTFTASSVSADDHDGTFGGVKKAYVSTVQRILSKRGFYDGEVDGRLDESTRRAVSRYQRALGVKADGNPDLAFVNRLRLLEAKTRPEGEAKGDRSCNSGKWVLSAQKALKRLGYDPGPIDGCWGPLTRRALVDFRVEHGLKGPARLTPEIHSRILSAARRTDHRKGNADATEPERSSPRPEPASAKNE